jgi:peptidoglycan/xylan/chitin deacetylase (PgdA/CDA1 family)/GT2 family glycosyltransferase
VQAPAANPEGLPFVSVVIPAYNEQEYLPLCLESIVKQDYAGDYEVIVVDNASTDDTARIALKYGARVVPESKRSPACARQKGVEVATGEIVAFIDADTQAPPHWLSTIVSRFLTRPDLVALSGPYAYFDVNRVIRSVSYFASFICICLDHLFRRVLGKGGALWGSNFAVRRSALLKIGGFDTSIKFYGEEYELSLRLREAGKAGIIPRLFVLTSARRLKKLGVVTQYWNWVVDYFSVLFWYKPIPERLEDLPSRALRATITGLSWRRAYLAFIFIVLVLGLFWLHTSPLIEAKERLLYVAETGIFVAFLTFHGVNPRSRLYGRTWSKGNGNHRRIALTFDDGPNEPYTSRVLDILAKHEIKATFFIIGQNARRYPDTCRRIVAEGNAVGNHSYHHRKSLCLRWGKSAVREIELTRQAINECTGTEVKLFRPPHGLRTPWLMHTLRRLQYTVITWDNMTDDWEADKPADSILSAIIKKTRPGGIIVLHDGRSTRQGYDRSQMLKALPQIISSLKEQSYDFVTVPELLKDGEHEDNGCKN